MKIAAVQDFLGKIFSSQSSLCDAGTLEESHQALFADAAIDSPRRFNFLISPYLEVLSDFSHFVVLTNHSVPREALRRGALVSE